MHMRMCDGMQNDPIHIANEIVSLFIFSHRINFQLNFIVVKNNFQLIPLTIIIAVHIACHENEIILILTLCVSCTRLFMFPFIFIIRFIRSSWGQCYFLVTVKQSLQQQQQQQQYIVSIINVFFFFNFSLHFTLNICNMRITYFN